ncbi:uncharacterized protein FA14DRAFT_160293 [Meira miltonrushii]|uniref:DUF4484 domain-containing protein n=1 Tax=Meira miltonrushii TaxID=1280837 RepID=A0A316VB65_9BASI|nr:uncharacterized protein FA14DRAFT_160293 [Meira miltonrushii]PWN34877.1 hypothetical protein FA14DRAFT_160293 [Meira miltonrushii]
MSMAESSEMGNARQTVEDAVPVQNGVTIFAAHFHVRRGNEIFWAKGQHSTEDLTKMGIEWKVLPSGSHLLERDILFFDVVNAGQNKQRSNTERGHLVGVAAFKNRKINIAERESADGNDNDDQRGARMIAVGIIVDCGSQRTPWSQLAATLPHICQLEKLADAVAADPGCHGIMEEWLEIHKSASTFITTSARDLVSDGPFYPHDPLLQLPAVSNALGPLLPGILKRLLASPFRLLIFTPHGGPALQAASIAFNLAELVHAACQSPENGAVCPATGRSSKKTDEHGLDVIGILGLHDISRLESANAEKEGHSWIGWTSDRILLEKPKLFDAVLDLSPMAPTQDSDFIDSTSLPRFSRSRVVTNSDGKQTFTLQKQTWTTREFSIYRGLDERASYDASSMRQSRRALSRRKSQSSMTISSDVPQNNTKRQLNVARSSPSRPSTSTMLAFLTYWLSSLRILPLRWRLNLRESYGYVPLSIRSDGGVRASIMLLPSDSEEEDEEDDEGEADESGSTRGYRSGSNRLSIPSSSPILRRRSLDGNPEENEDRDEYMEDPILAAVGVNSVASRRRHSRSLASKQSATHLASEYGASVSPDQSVKGSNANLHQSLSEERQLAREAREGVRLALCLFVSWSDWIDELVVSIQDLIHEKIIEQVGEGRLLEREGNGHSDANGSHTDDGVHPGQAPLNGRKEVKGGSKIILSAKDFTQVGLSSVNPADVDLIRFLSSSVTDVTVDVQKSWSVFSWLCW